MFDVAPTSDLPLTTILVGVIPMQDPADQSVGETLSISNRRVVVDLGTDAMN
jgi:hypothetical protein